MKSCISDELLIEAIQAGETEKYYRIVIVAREIEQLSTDETAAALGLTDFAVKSRLHGARLFLRQKLQDTLAVAS